VNRTVNPLVPGQVNHGETEAPRNLGNNGSPSGNGELQRAGPPASSLAAGPPGIVLAVSDPWRHLQPGMFTATLAQGLDRAGCKPDVRNFSRALNGWAKPEDLVCVPPQAGSANADILTLLAHRRPRTVIVAPGAGQLELLDDELTATPPRVCVLAQRRIEEMANCQGERAMERLSRWMPGIALVGFALDGAMVVPANGARIVLPRYDLPVVDPEGADEAFVAGLIAGLARGQGLANAATVGLAQMACVAAAEGPVAGLMSLKRAAEFITEQAQARRQCCPLTRLLKRFGLSS